MSYPQQQGPYGQPQYGGYQQPGQYGGGPPPKSNATAIALVIVLVAVLAGVGITGFVAPGFFLGDDKESGEGGTGAGSRGAGAGSGSEVDQFAGELVSAANEQDKAALSGFKCADATDGVDAAIDAIDQTDGAELSDTKEIAEDEYNLVISISYQGSSAPFSATVTKAENGWCWQDFAEGSGGGSGSDSDSGPPASGPSDSDGGGGSGGTAGAQTYAEEFLAAINAKDEATAEGMICSDTPSNSLVSFVIKKNPQLEIASVEDAGSHFVDFELGGTVDGGPVTTGSVSVRVTGGGSPCIFTFIAG
jgi:hypothetical protein